MWRMRDGKISAPGGVDGGLAESSGSLSKRKRSQTLKIIARQMKQDLQAQL